MIDILICFAVFCWLFSAYQKQKKVVINIWHIIDFVFAPIVVPYIFLYVIFSMIKGKINE